MSINNRSDFLAWVEGVDGSIVTDHLLPGSNVQLAPGTYTPDWDNNQFDSVTFTGTARTDTLFGGGGEIFTFFLGTRGGDLYGTEAFSNAYVDYSGARTGVCVDMSYRGSRTFTGAGGEVRTVPIIGKADDGLGETDYFAESAEPGLEGFSSIIGIFGSSRRDVMIAGGGFDEFYGGRGNDLLIGGFSHGGEGNDRLIGRATGDFQYAAAGDEGNDFIRGTDYGDFRLQGGVGNDRIFARGGNDLDVRGEGGNDVIDGGAGNDFIDGGIGADNLISGPGSDIINPDVEFFQLDPTQPTDGAHDVIRVTGDDVGDFTDRTLSRAFEAGLDEIRFADAVSGGDAYRVFHEAQTINELTGLPFGGDQAGLQNTVLQIDQNGNGFGSAGVDVSDYFMVVLDVTLTEHCGFILS
jgi:Ca2+-binding RTX toxin-like protein